MQSIGIINLLCVTLAIVCMYIGAWVAGQWMTRKAFSHFKKKIGRQAKGARVDISELDVSCGFCRIIIEFADGSNGIDISAPSGETLNLSSYGDLKVITSSTGRVLSLTTHSASMVEVIK